jgi:hypothetical protein
MTMAKRTAKRKKAKRGAAARADLTPRAREIRGGKGVINTSAISLPKPPYPAT